MTAVVMATGADRGQTMPTPGRGHRGRAVLARAGLLAMLVAGPVVSAPSEFGLAWFILLVILMVGSVVSLLVRYRQAPTGTGA
jgi:hypothetical protein